MVGLGKGDGFCSSREWHTFEPTKTTCMVTVVNMVHNHISETQVEGCAVQEFHEKAGKTKLVRPSLLHPLVVHCVFFGIGCLCRAHAPCLPVPALQAQLSDVLLTSCALLFPI